MSGSVRKVQAQDVPAGTPGMCRSPGPASFARSTFSPPSFDTVRRLNVLLAPISFAPVSLPSIVPSRAPVFGLCPVIGHRPSMRGPAAKVLQCGMESFRASTATHLADFVQLDAVAGGIADEGLSARPHAGGLRGLDSLRAQVGNRRVEIVHL